MNETTKVFIQLFTALAAVVAAWLARKAVVKTDQVHVLVNSSYTEALQSNLLLATKLFALTGRAEDQQVMENAKEALRGR